YALHIPPLRERREDILPLVEHFVEMTAKSMLRTPPGLSRDLRQALMSYDFPGNVRELFNMVHNAITYNRTETLILEHFPGLAPGTASPREIVRKIGNTQFALHGVFHDFPTIDEVQELLVEEAITLSHGNRSIAAKMLGVSRPTLQKRLERVAEKRSDDSEE